MSTDNNLEPGIEIPASVSEDTSPLPWAARQAQQELKTWGEDSFERIRRANDERWLRAYGWIVLVLTVVFSSAFALAFLVWGLHYTTTWVWLEDWQLDKIQSVLFSGGMGAIVSGIIRTQLGKTRSRKN